MSNPVSCLVPGCLRRDVDPDDYLCAGHLELYWAPEQTECYFAKWAVEQGAREAVRTPLPPVELVRVGSTAVEGGWVSRYENAHHAHDVAPGATNWAREGAGQGVPDDDACWACRTRSAAGVPCHICEACHLDGRCGPFADPSHANGVGHG